MILTCLRIDKVFQGDHYGLLRFHWVPHCSPGIDDEIWGSRGSAQLKGPCGLVCSPACAAAVEQALGAQHAEIQIGGGVQA